MSESDDRARYSCSGCGETFETLSRKRLHDCPADVDYGGDDPTEVRDVDDEDPDDVAAEAVDELLVCFNCETKHDELESFDYTMTDDGLAFAGEFTCEACGAHNENTVTLE